MTCELIKKTGYPDPSRRKEAWSLWQLLRERLSLMQTAVLWIDEAHDLFCADRNLILRAIKTLMQGGDAIVVILSGTEDLAKVIRTDPQVQRRFSTTFWAPLVEEIDGQAFEELIAAFCERAGLVPTAERDLIGRLFHASRNRFGQAIEYIIHAIEQALLAEDDYLSIDHFATAWQMLEGRIVQENIFWADQWWLITPDQAVRATEMLGGLLAFGPNQRFNDMTQDMRDAAGREAWSIVSSGDSGIRATLKSLLANTSNRAGIASPRKAYGMLYSWLSASNLAKHPGPIRELVREQILDTTPVKRGQILLGRPVDAPRYGTIAKVAAAELLHSPTLRDILIAKGLVPTARRNVPCCQIIVTNAEVDPIIAFLQNLVPTTHLPELLGASQPLVDALFSAGLLRRIRDQDIVGELGQAVARADVEELLLRLGKRIGEVDEVPPRHVPLEKAAEKTRTLLVEIVMFLFDGRLRRCCRLRGGSGFHAVMVDPIEIKRALGVPRPGMSAPIAFLMLGINPAADKRLLESHGDGPLLRANDIDRDPWISPDAMADFRERYVTKKRLPLETGLRQHVLEKEIRERGIRPMYDPRGVGFTLYRRSDLPDAWLR
ncbi:TniB family NTP-binding protein [Acidimangrovimonas sediminis]|uniref:TniB family NTP-binding protein n=1 Tax=Acidimangrovimonas sediminis TaxID=2056283 RepID=UPI001E330D96|nr:TniB family NTP-binding protein [Acidimangrovimonas sediminis]